MIVVTNTALAQRRRRLAYLLSFGGMGVLAIGLFLNLRAPAIAAGRSTLLTFTALVVGSLMSWAGILLADRWVAPPRPEAALAGALKSAGQKYRLYNWVLPADHVLQAPWGIVVFAVFNHEGPVLIDGPRWRDGRSLARRLLSYGRRPIRNPARWVEQETEALRAAFAAQDDLLALVPIEPVAVFTRAGVELHVTNRDMTVLQVEELKVWLRQQSKRPSLSPLVQRRLQQALDQLAQARLAD